MTGRARLIPAMTCWLVVVVVVEMASLAALTAVAVARNRERQDSCTANRILVRHLGLTDLALAPGTSYTRHPSQSDLFAAYGSHPSAIEHFPAGSVVDPPATRLDAALPTAGAPRP